MQLYGLRTCDTCRKARAALPHARFVDVRMHGVPETTLTLALERFGPDLVNTRSTTWRGLSETDRARPAADLLTAHPTLMKRPLIVDDAGNLHLGWSPQTRHRLGVD